jgi:hypothetical protein
MCKEIVRLESPEDPGERSRLWSEEDIVQVLEENTVRLIHMDGFILSLTLTQLFRLLGIVLFFTI